MERLYQDASVITIQHESELKVKCSKHQAGQQWTGNKFEKPGSMIEIMKGVVNNKTVRTAKNLHLIE
jgi:hypothetical protein